MQASQATSSRFYENCIDVDHNVACFNRDFIYSAESSALNAVRNACASSQDVEGGGVYVGTSGLALMLVHLDKAECLQEASSLCDSSLHLMNASRQKQRVSFLEGLPGPVTLRLILDAKNANIHSATQRLQELLAFHRATVKHMPFGECEVLYGRAGFLYSLLLARKHVPGLAELCAPTIQDLVHDIIEEGRTGGAATGLSWPLMYSWHGKHYLGAAHGLVGILYMLLHCTSELDAVYPDGSGLMWVRETVQKLMETCFPSGNLPSSLGSSSDRLVQWCHGAPGFIALLTRCHELFGSDDGSFLAAAARAAEVVWQRGLLTKGVGLCHGIAGNGYSFLTLYRATGDVKYLCMAQAFAEFAAKHWQQLYNVPDTPASLFEGLAGCVCFWHDVLQPEHSRFPGWEL